MSDSLITLILVSDVSESVRSLTKNELCDRITQVTHQNERPWANGSGRSEELSERERNAQVAHQKWVTERIAHFFEWIAHSLTFWQKTSDSLRKQISEFPALL